MHVVRTSDELTVIFDFAALWIKKKNKEKKSIADVLSKMDHYVTEEAESEKSKSLQITVKSAQMKIAGFVARHDNAFLLVDDLVKLVKEIFDNEEVNSFNELI